MCPEGPYKYVCVLSKPHIQAPSGCPENSHLFSLGVTLVVGPLLGRTDWGKKLQKILEIGLGHLGREFPGHQERGLERGL